MCQGVNTIKQKLEVWKFTKYFRWTAKVTELALPSGTEAIKLEDAILVSMVLLLLLYKHIDAIFSHLDPLRTARELS